MPKANQKLRIIECPSCRPGNLVACTDSRPNTYDGIAVVRRRKVCNACGETHTTIEMSQHQLDQFQERTRSAIVRKLLEGAFS